MSDIESFIADRPDYSDDIRSIVEYQEQDDSDSHFVEDTEYDSCWEYNDVGVSPQRIYQLEVNGIVEKVFDSNSRSVYTLKEPDKVKEVLENSVTQDENGMLEKMHDFPSEDELPDDLFDDVIGYDKVKWLLKRALTTDGIVNVLLIGPPGSAKTVFLLCIKELQESIFVSGSSSSGPGVLDVMFEHIPRYVCIDEFDDVDSGTQEVLSQHMDTGILDETKHGKNRTVKTNTKTFASANTTDSIIDQVESRFVDLHFDPYTRDEFIEICEHLLPRREGSTKEEARYIADEVWEMERSGDVRKAIAVARLSDGDPEEIVGVLQDYSGSGSGINSIMN